MKRITAFAVALLCLGVASAASAAPTMSSSFYHWNEHRLAWRNTLPNSGTTGNTIDSSTACGDGLRADTTAAYPLHNIVLEPFLGRNAATLDSSLYAILRIIPAGSSPTVSADTIYVMEQTSLDGVNWVDVTQTRAYNIAGTRSGTVVLEYATSNCFGLPLKQLLGAATGGLLPVVEGATATTGLKYWGQYAIRFIVNSTNDGCYEAWLDHWE